MTKLESVFYQKKIFFSLVALIGSLTLGSFLSLTNLKVILNLSQGILRPENSTDILEIHLGINKSIKLFQTAIAQTTTEKEQMLNFSVPVEFEGAIIREVALNSDEKVVALTFDDGPWQDTLPILEILKQHDVKATFFWIGQHLQNNPQIAEQVVAEGHAIGNHSWHHRYHQFDPVTAAREIDDTAALIYRLTGAKTALFRPPGGILDNGLVAYAQQQKYAIAMWSVDTHESRHPSATEILSTVLTETQPGGIILLHDGGGNHATTIEVLPQIITQLKERGYKFVTLPELLKMQTQANESSSVAASPPSSANPID